MKVVCLAFQGLIKCICLYFSRFFFFVCVCVLNILVIVDKQNNSISPERKIVHTVVPTFDLNSNYRKVCRKHGTCKVYIYNEYAVKSKGTVK